ncbi:glutathione S-transferase family protein [Microbulbifer epialgicus]|uniref:Glutathione S-transferase family protein n=1 Tax=Microbulbifer epialgicus TaxID=393907 RepID=A0ABV4P652_9GAMM
MYKLFIANKNYSSWSLRPWLLMCHLEIPFNEQLVNFEEGGSWEKFHSFSPTGLVPCLVDNDTTVWDSLAIAEYLAESYSQVWPIDKLARAWARSASAEMHSGFVVLREVCAMNCGLIIELKEISEQLKKELNRIDELWQEGLGRFGGPFLAGKTFTAVDAFYAPIAIRLKNYNLPTSHVAEGYVEGILNLPAMKRWISEALQEPWRESAHEEEVNNSGLVVEDLRG